MTLARGQQHYFLPLAALWPPAETELRQGLLQVTLAELRQFRREGALVDALSQDGFVLALMEAIGRETTLPLDGGEIRCLQTPSYDRAAVPEQLTVRRAGLEQSNSSVFFDEFGMLKLYRRLEAGPHPEIEMSRFLVERAGFANTPPPLATIELAVGGENEKRTMALGVLFGFVRNQGDGWTQALNYLTRYLDDALIATDARSSELADPDVFFLALARQIGIRTAEMHRALAEHGGDDPDFAPEPITREDLAEWRTALETETASMLSRLEREAARLPATGRERAESLLSQRDRLFAHIRTLLPDEVVAQKTRLHGDYHLGQVIVAQNDFFIVDFEGEPSRPLATRRAKSSPLRDVAGMIRSFDYAAVAAVRQLAAARPAAEPRMLLLAETWRQRAVDGFRAAYRKTMRGCAAYPASKKQARDMTAFFILEKAVYEVSYELANRPAWVDIPLHGILAVLDKTAISDKTRAGAGGQRSDPPRPQAERLKPKPAEPELLDPQRPDPPPQGAAPQGPGATRPEPEIEAIVAARHGDPFAFLGMHKTGAGLCVRAILPGAQQVAVVDSASGAVVAEATRVHPAGFFIADIPDRQPFRYRLRVSGGGLAREFDDIYRFPPVLGELDVYLLAEGNHLASYQKLGAHPVVHEGIEGIAFALWAPNAQAVSVVGDFNAWDGRRMPMRRRAPSGFWELFVPALRPGHLYKYQIHGPDGELLPLKADPQAGKPNSHPEPPRSLPTPRAMSGRTACGWPSAGAATTAKPRSRSTRSISARGGATSPRTAGI